MPAINQAQKSVNAEISLELQCETTKTTMKAYSKSLYEFCATDCINLKSKQLSQGEKECVLTCFRRRNMAVNSYIRSLLTEL